MAYFVIYTFYISAAGNLILIIGESTFSILASLKNLYIKCKRRKTAKAPSA